MKRLTNEEFWESRHEGLERETGLRESNPRSALRRWLDHARLRVGAEPLQSYAEFLLHKAIVTHLPMGSDWRAIEVGCAPGKHILRLAQDMGYQPFGVEYSPVGAATTRRAFSDRRFDPAAVIEADFFSASFQEEHNGRYDVALSLGFVEHFDDPAPVVQAHVDLLKPGGFLVCSIPNLRSFAYPFLSFFGREILDAHNLDIMRLDAYRALFSSTPLDMRFCGYVGVFQLFGVALRRERSLRGMLARGLDRTGDLMNHLLFLLLRGSSPETCWSPHIVYIGRKRIG